MIPLLSIDYDEPPRRRRRAPLSYRGVLLRMRPGEEPERFHTGDPTIDYLTAGAVVYGRLGSGASILGSSSVDHFVIDGGTLDDEDPTSEQVQAAMLHAKDHLVARGEWPPKNSTSDAP